MLLKFSEKSFGLDISENSLRIIQLKKLAGKIRISTYSEITVPDGWIKDGLIIKKDEVSDLVKKLIKKAKGKKIHTKYANICLSEPRTFIKVIRVPFRKGKEVISDIIAEAEKHIPYSLEESYFDWQYIDEKDKTKVIIGVCPKEIVDNYQEVLSNAGIIPIALEVEASAIVRSLFPLNKKIENSVIVIDLGASRTGLIIYEKNYIPFSLSLNVSSNDITKHIKSTLNLSLEKAEEAKREIGLDKKKAQGGLKKVLEKPLTELCRQVREAKYFYREHFVSEEIDNVYLTGGGSYLPGITGCISEHSNLNGEMANPLVNIAPGKLKIPEGKVQSFSTAIGLALRRYE